jgi:hypothetical protein
MPTRCVGFIDTLWPLLACSPMTVLSCDYAHRVHSPLGLLRSEVVLDLGALRSEVSLRLLCALRAHSLSLGLLRSEVGLSTSFRSRPRPPG